MIRMEWYKSLIKNKMLLLIAIAILLKFGLLCFQSYDYNQSIEMNKDEYMEILEWAKGEVSPEKSDEIVSYYNYLIEVVKERNVLTASYANSEIDSEAYRSQYLYLTDELENRYAFNFIYNQYLIAESNPEQSWVIYENGWNAFWSNLTPDILLILLITVFSVLVICEDYEKEMDCILKTSCSGRKKMFVLRLSISIFTTALLVLIFLAMELLYIHVRFGLYDYLAPVQSIASLWDSSFQGNLLQALFGVTFFRLLGGTMLVILVQTIAYWMKRSLASIIVSSIVVYAPYLLQSTDSTIYHLPTPIGMLEGKGYFWGSMNEALEGRVQVYFQSVSKEELLLIISSMIIISVVLVMISYRLYIGRNWNKRLGGKKLSHIMLCVVCAILLSGCGAKDRVVYNSDSDYFIYDRTKDTIILEDEIYIIRSETDEKESLLMDAFYDEEKSSRIRAIYGIGDAVYFLYNNDTVEIYKIDLNTYVNTCIYEYDYTKELQNATNTMDLLDWTTAIKFWVDGNDLYIQLASTIKKINMTTNVQEIICTDVSGTYSYDDGMLYFINSDSQLIITSAKDKEEYESGIYATKCWIEDDQLFYEDIFSASAIIPYE